MPVKPFVKPMLAVICFGLLSATAQADQCAYISVGQASRALNHLKPASTLVNFCEPCGDTNFWAKPKQTVNHLAVRKIEDLPPAVYWEIEVNGRGIDLAYSFLKMKDGSFMNLSKLARCPASGVTANFAGNKPKK